MATEPNQNQIEEALKACAEARRRAADPPFEMPPRTLRTLQAEIDRRWGGAARERARTNWWNVLWPRLGWAVAGVSVLVIAAMVYLGDSGRRVRQLQLAAKSASEPRLGEDRTAVVTPAARPEASSLAVAKHESDATVGALGGSPERENMFDFSGATGAVDALLPASAPLVTAAPVATPNRLVMTDAGEPTPAILVNRAETVALQATATNAVVVVPTPATWAVATGQSERALETTTVAEPMVTAGRSATTDGEATRLGVVAPPTTATEALTGPAPASGSVPPLSERYSFETNLGSATSVSRFILPAGEQSLFATDQPIPPIPGSNRASAAAPAADLPAVAGLGNVPGEAAAPDHSGGRASEVYRASLQRTQEQQAALTAGRRFVQAPVTRQMRRNFNSPPPPTPPPVLQDFRLRQVGRDLQITDRDGSVYLARLQSPAPDSAKQETKLTQPNLAAAPEPVGAANSREKRPAARADTVPAGQPAAVFRNLGAAKNIASNELAFGAVGTNRSLNQVVVFNGRLVFTNGSIAVPSQAVNSADPEVLYLWLNNSTLRGEATVGRTTRLDVRAVPAE